MYYFWGPAGPGAPRDPVGRVSRAPRAGQTPKIDHFRARRGFWPLASLLFLAKPRSAMCSASAETVCIVSHALPDSNAVKKVFSFFSGRGGGGGKPRFCRGSTRPRFAPIFISVDGF